MKKIILLMLLAGVIALGISSHTTVSINPILKKTVHHFAPAIMGTKVQLEDAKLSTLSGYGTLRNLIIANPTGFPKGNCIIIGNIDVDMDASTLGTGVVTINNLTITGMDVAYLTKRRKNNVASILTSLRHRIPEKRRYPPNPSEEVDYKKVMGNKYIIKNVHIITPSVNGFLPPPQTANYSVIMDDMHFTDIGTEENGIPFLVALEHILTKLEDNVRYSVHRTEILYNDR